jgi:hypothetical protein
MTNEPEPQMPITEVKAMINHLIDSRSHWIFIPGANGIAAVEEIHRRFYADATSDEFMEFIITPADGIGGFVFFIADKQRLGPKTLEVFLDMDPTAAPFRSFVNMSQVDLVALADVEVRPILIRNFVRCFAPKLPPPPPNPGRWN